MQVLKVALFAFVLSLIVCPFYIYFSRRLNFRQQVRQDGPFSHLKKRGTPTMGGIVFLFAFLVPLLLMVGKTPYLIMAVLITLCCAFLGFIDDYHKVLHGSSLGLKARAKLGGQLTISLIFCAVLLYYGHSTVVNIPFTAGEVDLGLFYPVLMFFIIIGTTNAVNLTDGLDGLAGGTSVIALIVITVIAVLRGMPDMAAFCGVLAGAVAGFLIFNFHPAKVFMGDVGSLALGAALGAAAIVVKAEFYLIIAGGVFVLETLSVILQVTLFKLTGKRILLMSPLHHHFELKGWSEWQVAAGFWAFGIVLAAIVLLDFTRLAR